ncbi:transmembrane protein 120B isoform X1 [Chiloscyllium plagiosum]|uniref:transmembrane protein 120B isoform X1 n=1 Tax=Chiloscyllium plagiosum TaxID=36176 RepID=UPI001CB7F7B7|nr:transmembrane protein 120B isoform X1 [Chiloscyllium plagiosum]
MYCGAEWTMSLLRCQAEWEELDKEFKQLQETHKVYRQKLDELSSLQIICSNSISKQKRRIKDLACNLRRYKHSANVEEAEVIQKFNNDIKERRNVFFEMEAFLPKKNGLYLNLVLGNVNVTLLSKQAKFAYKDEYEKFKLYLTIILLLGAISCMFLLNRVIDEIFNFLLVWYYCTLTIRESVLISNGSRIKGWWVSHHYVSTFLSGVMLTWPNGLMYQMFRSQFIAFSIYQSCVQFLQYYYQSGCLYRLRALGERDHMDLTVEGFQSWMWRGLTFLLPFLFFGHFWQLYNSVTLFGLAQHERCKEWQGRKQPIIWLKEPGSVVGGQIFISTHPYEQRILALTDTSSMSKWSKVQPHK